MQKQPQKPSAQLLTNISRAAGLASASSKSPLSPLNSGQHPEFPGREVGVVNKSGAQRKEGLIN